MILGRSNGGGVVLIVALLAAPLVATVTPGPAYAKGPTAAQKEDARTWMLEGRELRKKGDLKGALERFRAAHALMNVPTTGLELGRTQAELGLLLEARDTLLTVSRMPVEPKEPEIFATARAESAKLAEEIAPRLATLTVKIEGPTEGVAMTLDGVALEIEQAHLPHKANPGKHVLRATLGGREKTTSFELADGETKGVVLDVTSLAATTAPPAAPATPSPSPTPAEAAPSGGVPTLAWIGFGVAAVGLGVGAYTGLSSNAKGNDLEAQCGADGRCPASLSDDLSSARTMGNISTVSFIVAGVGATVGVIALIARPSTTSADAKATRSVDLGLALGLSGAALQGTF